MNLQKDDVAKRCLLFECTVLTCFGMMLLASQSHAATENAGLSSEEERALASSVDRNDIVAAQAIVIAALARASNDTTEIIRDLYTLAPTHVDRVLKTAIKTFPDLGDRITAVATEVAMEVADNHPLSQEEPVEIDPQHWSGEVAVGGSYRQATTNTSTASIAADFNYEGDLWEHYLSGSLDYGRTGGVTDTHRLVLDLKTQRQISESFYLFSLGAFEDDRFSGFDYQFTEGAGLGYKIFDTPVFKLNIEGGPSVRQRKVSATQEVTNEILARLAVDVNWNFSDTATFTNETSLFIAEGKVEVGSSGGVGIDNEQTASNLSTLDIKIVSNLSARLSYEFRYRNNPPIGAPTTTSLAKFMLVQSF